MCENINEEPPVPMNAKITIKAEYRLKGNTQTQSAYEKIYKKIKSTQLSLINGDQSFKLIEGSISIASLEGKRPIIIIKFNENDLEPLTIIFAKGSEDVLARLSLSPQSSPLQSSGFYRKIPITDLKEPIDPHNNKYKMNWSFGHVDYELNNIRVELDWGNGVIHCWDASAIADITPFDDPVSMVQSIFMALVEEEDKNYRIVKLNTLNRPGPGGATIDDYCDSLTESQKAELGSQCN